MRRNDACWGFIYHIAGTVYQDMHAERTIVVVVAVNACGR
jgi:hypothetical protein